MWTLCQKLAECVRNSSGLLDGTGTPASNLGGAVWVLVQKPEGFDQPLADRIALLPGVEAATLMDPVPLWFAGSFARFTLEGGAAAGLQQRIGYSRVAPDYFETLQIPLLQGRDFTRSDNASAPGVVIINETMAGRFWPAGDALGQRIRTGEGVSEIVGVARDAKHVSLAETSQFWLYQPLAQVPSENTSLSLAVRTSGDPSS